MRFSNSSVHELCTKSFVSNLQNILIMRGVDDHAEPAGIKMFEQFS